MNGGTVILLTTYLFVSACIIIFFNFIYEETKYYTNIAKQNKNRDNTRKHPNSMM